MSLSPELSAWLSTVLSDPQVLSQPEQTQVAASEGRLVLELGDRTGRRWFLKVEPRISAWTSEVSAYREWLTGRDDLAPALLAADEGLRAMVLSAIPGEPASAEDPEHHRLAGAWLRQLHESVPGRPGQGSYANTPWLEGVFTRHHHVLSDEEYAFARDGMAPLQEEPNTVAVPNHGDFRAHNWLLDAGVLRAIDYGQARWAPGIMDLSWLAFGHWWNRPATKTAFLAGYGRALTAHEEALLVAELHRRALREVCLGEQLGLARKTALGRRRLRALMAGATSAEPVRAPAPPTARRRLHHLSSRLQRRFNRTTGRST